MTVIKRVLLVVLSLLLSCSAMAEKKVLIVGLDGFQLEKMQALDLPNIARLSVLKAYAGGVKGKVTEQETLSGPGW